MITRRSFFVALGLGSLLPAIVKEPFKFTAAPETYPWAVALSDTEARVYGVKDGLGIYYEVLDMHGNPLGPPQEFKYDWDRNPATT